MDDSASKLFLLLISAGEIEMGCRGREQHHQEATP
jgi:hypothetical protein